MARQKVKGTGHKQPTDTASEPNFYAMPAVTPQPTSSAPSSSYEEMPTTAYPSWSMMEGDDQEYNPLLNSPGIQAATLLKRLSSVGTPSQFSLEEINALPPPLVSGATETIPQSTIYRFDSFRSEDSSPSLAPLTMFATEALANAGNKTEKNEDVEHEHAEV